MALKVKYAVKRDTNVPGILRWENHGAITKCNRWKLIRSSVLSLFNFSLFNDIQEEITDKKA